MSPVSAPALMIFQYRDNPELTAQILLISRIYLIGCVLGCPYANCEPILADRYADQANLLVGREFFRFNRG